MLEVKPSFRQLPRRGEYLRLEDMGLIGDGTAAALVGLDGSICWSCLPRFDSEPVFNLFITREGRAYDASLVYAGLR